MIYVEIFNKKIIIILWELKDMFYKMKWVLDYQNAVNVTECVFDDDYDFYIDKIIGNY